MTISRKATKPVGITNQSGEPEITLEVGELKLSLAPPKAAPSSKPQRPTNQV